MQKVERGLWRNRDFLRLWAGETVSLVGSQITTLALPLAAAVTLAASPAQLGLLGAAGFAPFLFVTLFAGVWIDRAPRRPVMVSANAARAVLLAAVPALAFVGLLRIELLYAVAFLAGVFQVLFELAYQSYVPSLVGRTHLVEGNSKLQASASAAQIGGPGLAGLLVELVTAPFALLVDAASFLVSALNLAAIRKPEPVPAATAPNMLGEIGLGLRLVIGNPYLRAMAGEATTANGFYTVWYTVFVLFAVRELGLRPGVLGLVLSAGSVGALGGAVLAERAARRFGFGRAMVASYVLVCTPPLLIPLVGGPPAVAAPLLTAIFFLTGVGGAVSQISVYALRQAVTPDHLLGRMNAGYRFFVTGVVPFGALAGGALGETIGFRPTLALGAAGMLLALPWAFFSPIPRLHTLPTGNDAAGEQTTRKGATA